MRRFCLSYCIFDVGKCLDERMAQSHSPCSLAFSLGLLPTLTINCGGRNEEFEVSQQMIQSFPAGYDLINKMHGAYYYKIIFIFYL